MVQKLLGNLLLLLEGLVNLFYYGNCLWLQRGREKALRPLRYVSYSYVSTERLKSMMSRNSSSKKLISCNWTPPM